jgi:sulfatase modifying factor 1
MSAMLRFLRPFSPLACAIGAAAFLAITLPAAEDAEAAKGCPAGMASIRGKYCIDRYEASTVELLAGKKTRPHSSFVPVQGLEVRAVSQKGVKPQAYISRDEAEVACKHAGKRLCTDDEWMTACKGKHPTQFPYGDDRKDGYCNDAGVSSFNRYYGPGTGDPPEKEAYTWANMNDPRLNQLEGTLALTGHFKKCRSGFDVYDMVGNLHEWTAAKGGTFRGGYYLDTHINGDGCDYRTTAHAANYHDYSTGFRCCK